MRELISWNTKTIKQKTKGKRRQRRLQGCAGCHYGRLGLSHAGDTEDCVEHISEWSHQRMGMLGHLSTSSFPPVFEGCPLRCSPENSIVFKKAHAQRRGTGIWDGSCQLARLSVAAEELMLVKGTWDGAIRASAAIGVRAQERLNRILVNISWSSNIFSAFNTCPVLLVVR